MQMQFRTAKWAFAALGALSMAAAVRTLTGCAEALRLEPSGTAGQGAGPTTGPASGGAGGSGGGAPVTCVSSSDCSEPTSVCDVAKSVCVECLDLADCGFMPGTVCSKAACVCPGGDTYCGPGQCVDVMTETDNCGECGHACFGLCQNGACVEPWEPIALLGAPSPRSQHVAVWTGKQMIVWGGTSDGTGAGSLGDGGIYDLATRVWTPTSFAGAPTPRRNATAVWTGTEMVVWGGRATSDSTLGDGARFDPATNTWKTLPQETSPGARLRHSAVWSGTAMLIWGGDPTGNGAALATGYSYSPGNDAWSSMSLQGMLPVIARRLHSAVMLKEGAMMVFGGIGDAYDANMSPIATEQYFPSSGIAGAYQYSPMSDSWNPLSQIGEPSARAEHTAVYDGSRVLVFGGFDGSVYLNDGVGYDPKTNPPWQLKFDQPNLVSPRAGHTAVWVEASKRMVVWGGRDASGKLDTGAVFVPSLNSWEKGTPSVPLARRDRHTAISTGDQMIVWGGLGTNGSLNDGAVYSP
ncbi:MAG: hypothetical protein EXR75_14415 [Myxococcales bacterium]|nr:hypothetical protein [Myxococcales bacterium]